MANLIATGIDEQQYWHRELTMGEVIRLGRAPRQGWAVPWDSRVSREHAELELTGQGLRVRELETARNPILYRDKPISEFVVVSGDEFRIGHTTFQFHEEYSSQSSTTTFIEHTYTNKELRAFGVKNSESCFESLCDIPRLISESKTDKQFATEIVELLLDAMPDVGVVAIIQFDSSADYDAPEPKLMRWSSHHESVKRFNPSRRLMAKVLQRRCSAIHLWDVSQSTPGYTMTCPQ